MAHVIGLTGQSGAGKTTVSHIFEENGFAVINCDEIARICTQMGSECNKKLAQVFPECFDEKLSLDRKAISKIIFSDKKMLEKFDNIVYPFITQLIKEKINELSAVSQYILLDAPTLFESGTDMLCSVKTAVVADFEKRLERITIRDKIDKELAEKRFASQLSAEFFCKNCDYVIYNNGKLEDTINKTLNVIRTIKEGINGKEEETQKEKNTE